MIRNFHDELYAKLRVSVSVCVRFRGFVGTENPFRCRLPHCNSIPRSVVQRPPTRPELHGIAHFVPYFFVFRRQWQRPTATASSGVLVGFLASFRASTQNGLCGFRYYFIFTPHADCICALFSHFLHTTPKACAKCDGNGLCNCRRQCESRQRGQRIRRQRIYTVRVFPANEMRLL